MPLAARRFATAALVACIVGVLGCNPRKPLEIDPSLTSSARFDTITLMPVIDARPDRFDYLPLGRDVSAAAVQFVREKGYLVAQAESYAQRPPDSIDIDNVKAADLIALVPAEAHDFLIVQIEKMDRTIDEAGVLYYVRLSAVLVDRDAARVLWRDVASANNTLTGFFTIVTRGSSQFEAAVNASRSLFSTLPARPGSRAARKKKS